jgi:hypothetical protein
MAAVEHAEAASIVTKKQARKPAGGSAAGSGGDLLVARRQQRGGASMPVSGERVESRYQGGAAGRRITGNSGWTGRGGYHQSGPKVAARFAARQHAREASRNPRQVLRDEMFDSDDDAMFGDDTAAAWEAQYAADGQWYRVELQSQGADGCFVRFVDYDGEQAFVTYDQLRPLATESAPEPTPEPEAESDDGQGQGVGLVRQRSGEQRRLRAVAEAAAAEAEGDLEVLEQELVAVQQQLTRWQQAEVRHTPLSIAPNAALL